MKTMTVTDYMILMLVAFLLGLGLFSGKAGAAEFVMPDSVEGGFMLGFKESGQARFCAIVPGVISADPGMVPLLCTDKVPVDQLKFCMGRSDGALACQE